MPRRAGVDYEIRGRDRTKQAFASAQRNLDRLVGSGGRLAGLFSRGGAIAAGVASLGVTAGLVFRQLRGVVEQLDLVGKAAARAGIEAEELQVIQQFAARGGVELRAVNIGMQRFNRRVGDARRGNAALVKTFNELGVELDDVNGNQRSTIDILADVQRAFKAVSDDATAASLSASLFDSEGLGIGITLRNSADAIDEFADRAQRFGTVASNDVVRNAEQANDQFELLADVIKGRLNTAFDGLIVRLGNASEGFAEMLAGVESPTAFVDQLREDVAELERTIARSRGSVGGRSRRGGAGGISQSRRDELQAELRLLQARLAAFDSQEAAESRLVTIQKELAELGGIRELSAQELRRLNADEVKRRNAVRALLVEEDALTRFITSEKRKQVEPEVAVTEEKEKQVESEKSIAQLAREALDAEDKNLAIQREKIRIRRAELEMAFAGGVLSLDEYLRQLEMLGVLKRQTEVEGDIVATEGEIVARKERILELTQGTLSALEGFEDSTGGWLRLLGQALRLWQQFDQNRAVGALASGGAGGSSGGRQAGGMVRAGQRYRVNEPSGEVFVPFVDGRILSRSDAMSGGVNVQVNIEGVDYGADFARQVDAQALRIANVVREAVST